MADKSVQFLLQQIKDSCKWYFAHEVQVVTFHKPATDTWYAIVCPADCTLASTTREEVHLYGRALSYLPGAIDILRQKVNRLVGERFSVPRVDEDPVVVEREAPCKCACIAVVGDGGPGPVGSEDRDASGEHGKSSESNMVDAGSTTTQQSTADDIWPVLRKMQSTLEVIEQQTQHSPIETPDLPDHEAVKPPHSTEHVATATYPATVRSIVSQPAPGVDDLLAGHSRVPDRTADSERQTTRESNTAMPSAQLQPVEDRTRDIVREEISRVLAAAMGSLPGRRFNTGGGGGSDNRRKTGGRVGTPNVLKTDGGRAIVNGWW